MYFNFCSQVHYNSKTVSGDSPITSLSDAEKYCSEDVTFDSFQCRSAFLSTDSGQGASVGLRKVGLKKACLFAWVTLQSIPEVILFVF